MRNIDIAKNIFDLRKKNNITQEQLARAVNVSSQAVSKWETNTCVPDAQTMPLIAEYFDVSIDYLYYGDDKKVFPQMSKEPYYGKSIDV